MSAGHRNDDRPAIGQFAQLVQQTVKNDPLNIRPCRERSLRGAFTRQHLLHPPRRRRANGLRRMAQRPIERRPVHQGRQRVIIIGSVDVWPKRGVCRSWWLESSPFKRWAPWRKPNANSLRRFEPRGAGHPPRRLPFPPKHVAIVTGAGSAALSDMRRLMADRWPGMRTTVIEVLVQGEHAAQEIVRGLAVLERLLGPT